ncbi:hypothetical protein ABZ464_36935 [Streptomyces sp. NPDC005820]|uniref:hypothetical protein n=1 Tax=Streptomyces sp. NPDC005820 TaxID=3157069 RepID=UPI0033DF3C38
MPGKWSFYLATRVWGGAALTSAYVATMANVAPPKASYSFTDVADDNGDAKMDVVAADATGSLWLHPGNGSGGWSTSAGYIGSGLSGDAAPRTPDGRQQRRSHLFRSRGQARGSRLPP